MTRITRNSLIFSTVFLTQAVARLAAAQSDISAAAPNVLLLVDTSGSMECKTSSTDSPNCDPNSATNSEKSRWINLVEVLTGSINDYRCATVDRSSTAFLNEFSLAGNRPADYGYSIPYHRPISGNCIAGPGSINLTPDAFAVSDSVGGTRVGYHQYAAPASSCTFSQNPSDGLLSTYASKVRFGLMTFDTSTNAGTGYNGKTADFPNGIAGTWSYFVDKHQGKPGGCDALLDQEVGARNAAAPPWEGRMVAFGDPSPNSNDVNDNPTTRAQWIREILLTTRPYYATPIAGMLDDARAFLWQDTTKDPLDPTGVKDFGPYNDPYLLGGCRKNFIILLTDGEPNLELRPDCEKAGPPPGKCPYDHSYEITRDLYNQAGSKQVQTFVIGFAVSQVTLSDGTVKDCRTLTAADVDLTDSNSLCSKNSTNAALRACCVLDQIAYNGGTDHAFFADNTTELRTALSSVLSSVSTSTTSRTWPVMASGSGTASGSGNVAGYRFYTSFRPRLDLANAGLWTGVIERNRFLCTTPTGGGTPSADLQAVDRAAGDEFADNVNSGNGTSNRRFYSFMGANESGTILSAGMLRPNMVTDDGAGLHTGEQTKAPGTLADFVSKVLPESMSITDSTCATDVPTRAAAACRDTRLGWLLGQSVVNGTVTYTRCANPGSANCSLIADVYHSTPVVVNRPTEAPRDQTYQAFSKAWEQRPLMLYTSTNDGFLHAFKVGSNHGSTDSLLVDSLANNELWAFMPPAVLPDVVSEFPGTHLELLDGAPVVFNVVAAPTGAAYPDDSSPKYAFERTATTFAAATSGDESATTWRTVLVQGFGKHRGGYFALDITNPDTADDSPYKSKFPGPRFLWQLSETGPNRWLFGPSSATPLITTLFFQPTSTDTVAREIAVAILPGGNADAAASGEVSRGNTTPAGIKSPFLARTSVPNYTSSDALAARSLTIVRLDTGEIVRTFRRSKTEGNLPAEIQSRINLADLDSPITGQPVAYPALVGSLADRVFVGDRDGGLWRVDLSSTDPSNWTMNLFFDAYTGRQPRDGQPIVMPPQLSIDDSGQVTVAFSTGSQDDFSSNNAMLNFVWSLTEHVNWTDHTFEPVVNWYRRFNTGERVVGPMQLFGSGLYFATYQPDSGTTACGAGSSKIWGMNYNTLVDAAGLDKNNPPVAPSDAIVDTTTSVGGRPWLPEDGDPAKTTRVQFLDSSSSLLAGATVFGVAVAQKPSCVDNSTPTDSFFGTGLVHTTMPNVTPATYELVMQTGASGKNTTTGAVTKVTTMALPPPDNSPRIAAWATIME